MNKDFVTVFEAIQVFGNLNEGLSDKETHQIVKQTIKAMESKNSKWPHQELTKAVFKMDKSSKNLFLELLKDMDNGLNQYFGLGE